MSEYQISPQNLKIGVGNKYSNEMSAKLDSTLTYGLLHHPALLSELPLLINSFDKNETVLLQQVENVQYRDYLLQLMKLLPVITDGTGSYSKHPSVNSVGNWILEELAKSKSISQPNKLTEAQIMSSRTFPVYLFSILEKFPALINDLSTLFQTLLNGNFNYMHYFTILYLL